jgi:hypothetical protein
MRLSKKTLCSLGVLVLVGLIYVVGAYSKPAFINKRAFSPEIYKDRETLQEFFAEDLVFSGPLAYFPEDK